MGPTMTLSIVGIVSAIVSYLLGSISFAVIITKFFSKKDIRTMGSKNAGATNVGRSVGWKAGGLTLLGDFLKVGASVYFTRLLLEVTGNRGLVIPGTYWSGFFCLLGHLFPIYFKFKGGKGVMTSAGMILFVDYRVFLILVAIFIITLLISKMVSLASIVAAISFPIFTYLLYVETPPETEPVTRLVSLFYSHQREMVTLLSLLFAVIVVCKHHENIVRIIKGTESKFLFKEKIKKS